MKSNSIVHLSSFLLFLSFSLLSLSCSTGIEGTKTITYSKSEKKELAPTPEESLTGDILPPPLKEWAVGRRFKITDERAALIFENFPSASATELKGKEITFIRVDEKITPGGVKNIVVVFSDGTNEYRYPTGKSKTDALDNITSLDLPMLIDLTTVNKYRERLEGNKVWTRATLRYNSEGEKLERRKFVPVKIAKVSPGDLLFMIRLEIEEENGEKTFLYMNPTHRGTESRTFADLFYVSDPKLRHSSISPEVWDMICQGKVKAGMTKEECKLAVGNPDDVATGHDWNQTVDIWNYRNGMYLQFQDGLLTKFRI